MRTITLCMCGGGASVKQAGTFKTRECALLGGRRGETLGKTRVNRLSAITFTQRALASRALALNNAQGSEQPTSASGANLVLDSGPVVVSIKQVLMGKKKRHWLVPQGSELCWSARCHLTRSSSMILWLDFTNTQWFN